MIHNTLIIYNPRSGRIQLGVTKKIRSYLENKRIQYHFEEVNVEDRWKDRNPDDYDLIIVVAGDGTLKSVVNWLLNRRSKTPIAIIPFGSGNHFARAIGVPLNVSKALHIALSEHYRSLDVGFVNKQEYFLLGVGIGFDALLIRYTPKVLKRYLGFWSYFIGALRALFNLKLLSFTVKTESEEFQFQAKVGVVFNTAKFFGLNFHPHVLIDDGKLNLLIFRKRIARDLFQHLFHREAIQDLLIRNISSRTFHIIASPKFFVQVDGDEREYSELYIETIPKAIRVAVAS